ncbi:MAG: cytochrome c biogenesis protein CcdA [Pirellulales bacterium]
MLALVAAGFSQNTADAPPGLDLGFGGLQDFATSGNSLVSVDAKVVGSAAGGTLRINAEVAQGYHVYSITQKTGESGGPKRTTIKVTPGKGYKAAGDFVAGTKPKSHIDEVAWVGLEIEEHRGAATWVAPIAYDAGVKPEATTVEGVFEGQVCDDQQGSCRDFAIPFTATYEKPSATPGEITIFNAKVIGSIGVAAAAPGEKVPLRLTIEPSADWHAYKYSERPVDEDEFANLATLVAVTLPAGFTADATSAGSAEMKSDGLPYYDGPVTLTTMIEVPRDAKVGETKVIQGIIGFQVCKSKASCDPPTAARFTISLPIQSNTVDGEIPATLEKAKYGEAADAANSAVAPSLDATTFLGLIGAGLLGGLLLNLMPCVLPVIGLKVLSFVEQAHHDRKRVLALNLWYTAGLMLVFMALATLSVLLNLGWGEQFTSTTFKVVMSALVFAMALSFLGVWEIPIPGFVGSGRAADVAQQEGYTGAFAKGALTTVLATPCSAPFLGAVFGATLGQPGYVTYALFTAIGLGMASPYLLIGAKPELIRFLPKPGAWMETFKQAMAFLLLGTVVFLFSSLSKELVVPAFGLMMAIWVGCWWIGKTPLTAEFGRKAIGWTSGIALAAGLGYASFYFFGPVQRILPWREFSVAAVEKAKAEGKTVMIDFTADWCVNCKVNLKYAVDTHATLELVKKYDVVPFIADLTDESEEIKQALRDLKSNSIPVLAIFPAGQPDKPIVLRDLLEQQKVLDALDQAGASKPAASSAAQANAAQPTSTATK